MRDAGEGRAATHQDRQGCSESSEPVEEWRTTQNLFAAIVLILLLAAAVAVVDALGRTQRALDCLQAGRARCPGVEAPR